MVDRIKLVVVTVAVVIVAVIFWLSDRGGEGSGSLLTGNPLANGR